MSTRNTYAVRSEAGRLTFIGDRWQGGCYVLRIRVREAANVIFGGFMGGKAFPVEPGDYSYVGSALAAQGSSCLARRLVRHASRLDGGLPHPIRQLMLTEFPRAGLCAGDVTPAMPKREKWNVDHLLNLPFAELVEAVLIRTPVRVEARLGKFVEDDPAAVVFARGLGANDIKGNTHLLRIDGGEVWWDGLPTLLAGLFLNPID